MEMFGDERQRFGFLIAAILVSVCEAGFFKMASPELILVARKFFEFAGLVSIPIVAGIIVRCSIKPKEVVLNPNPHGHPDPVNAQVNRTTRRNQFRTAAKFLLIMFIEELMIWVYFWLKSKFPCLKVASSDWPFFVVAVLIYIAIHMHLTDPMTRIIDRVLDFMVPEVPLPPVVGNGNESWWRRGFRGLVDAILIIWVALCAQLLMYSLKMMYPALGAAENGNLGAFFELSLLEITILKYLVDLLTPRSREFIYWFVPVAPPAPPQGSLFIHFCKVLVSLIAFLSVLAAPLVLWFWVMQRAQEYEEATSLFPS